MAEPYYRADLARIHDLEFGAHAAACAPGILDHLAPIKGGLVVEFGCGSGALTRHLVDAGHRVMASDPSPAMLALARANVPQGEFARLALPADPLPAADAIVSTGHALNYLPDAGAIERALVSIARSLRPGGRLAIDICDLEWAQARSESEVHFREGDDWVLVARFAIPAPDRFDRFMTTFTREGDGWRRDDETHHNVLVDTARIPEFLSAHGVESTIGAGFGEAEFPEGLKSVIGIKTP